MLDYLFGRECHSLNLAVVCQNDKSVPPWLDWPSTARIDIVFIPQKIRYECCSATSPPLKESDAPCS
jgi:hypothetical protein